MPLVLKRLFLRLFIGGIKTGAVTTYYTKRVLRTFLRPLKIAGRLVLRYLGVPLYRAVFFVRRWVQSLYVPGKNKLMYMLTNRYATHGLVFVLVFFTLAWNVQASGSVRSEEFGQSSALYHLVTGQENQLVQIRGDAVASAPTRYLGPAALSVEPNIDFHSTDDDYVSVSAGMAISAPTLARSTRSTAPRTEVVSYQIQEGDTLGTIAEQHDVSLDTLLTANGLTVRSTIQPGDTLKILPVDGLVHTVKSGDTVLAIAKRYQADATDILEFNHLATDSSLQIGASLVVPGGKPPKVAVVRNTPKVTKVLSRPSAAPSTATGGGRMLWPTDLRVITQYFGWKHTGVDIDCHFTNSNYAADDGIVQTAGWKGGYGLTVEINHGNGIVTRYGHHAKLYVSVGESVKKGDALGLCGTTGKSTGTHLHFEVILGGKFQNPFEYIR